MESEDDSLARSSAPRANRDIKRTADERRCDLVTSLSSLCVLFTFKRLLSGSYDTFLNDLIVVYALFIVEYHVIRKPRRKFSTIREDARRPAYAYASFHHRVAAGLGTVASPTSARGADISGMSKLRYRIDSTNIVYRLRADNYLRAQRRCVTSLIFW